MRLVFPWFSFKSFSGLTNANLLTSTAVSAGILMFATLFLASASAAMALQDTESEEARAASRPYEPDQRITGVVTGADGNPQTNIGVLLNNGALVDEVFTDDQGRFTIFVPVRSVQNLFLRAVSRDGQLQGSMRLSWKPSSEELSNIKIKLQPARKVAVEVVDAVGNPVTDATVGTLSSYSPMAIMPVDSSGKATMLIPADVDVEFVFAISRTAGVDYRAFVLSREQQSDKNATKPKLPDEPIMLSFGKTKPYTITVIDDDGQPVAGIGIYPWLLKKESEADSLNVSSISQIAMMKTDESGVVKFDWIPDWPSQYVSFMTNSNEFSRGRADFHPESESQEATIVVSRKVLVKGTVKLDDGSPAVDLQIRFHGSGLRKGESTSTSDVATVFTNSDGHFEMLATPSHGYLGRVDGDQLKFAAPATFTVSREPSQPELLLTVRKPTRLHGQLTFGTDNKPQANQNVSITEYAELEVPIIGADDGSYHARPAMSDFVTTDGEGNYELLAGSGKFRIRGSSQNDMTYVEIADETEMELDFHAERPAKSMLSGRIIKDSDGSAVANAKIEGVYASANANGWNFTAESTADGSFTVERELLRSVVSVKSVDGMLAAIIEIQPDDREVEFRLVEAVNAKGRLVDADGKPMAGSDISFGRKILIGEKGSTLSTTVFGGTVTTDKNGNFELAYLVPGANYHVSYISEKKDGMAWRWSEISRIQPEPNQAIVELGDVVYESPVDASPPTTEERIARAFNVEGLPVERIENAKKRASLNKQLVLILLGSPNDPHTQQFGKLQYEDSEVRKLLFGYLTMAIDTSEPNFAAAQELAEQFDVELHEMENAFQMILADHEGNPIDHVELSRFSREGDNGLEIDKEKLIRLLTEHTPMPLDAKQLLDDALSEAKKLNKRVIVQETATWCGPCILLSEYLDRTRPIWSEDFIWVKMDHRWTGVHDIMDPIRSGASGGIPWFAILDADGNVLETSNDEEGENMGFPSDKEHVVLFKKLIQRSSIRMTQEQIDKFISAIKRDP